MYSKFTLSLSFIIISFVHFTVISSFVLQKEELAVARKSTIIPISLKKVIIKQKEIKKVEKVLEIVKEFKKVKLIKKVKIVKKAIKKIIKKEKIVKLIKKPIRKKIFKKEIKEQKKLVQTNIKKLPQIKREKIIISQNQRNIIKNEYLLMVKEHIEKYKYYPKRAKRLKQEGKVELSFIINKSGHISKIKLRGKCPYKRLNNAAIAILEKIAKFIPIPKELGKTSIEVNIPIEYYIINV